MRWRPCEYVESLLEHKLLELLFLLIDGNTLLNSPDHADDRISLKRCSPSIFREFWECVVLSDRATEFIICFVC